MSIPDHYLTLEIESSASDKEIKRAFWRLAKRFHPDKNPGDEKAAAQKFRQIITAYKVLINRETRDAYDRMLRSSRASNETSYGEDLPGKARSDDTLRLCRLILLELLNRNARHALEIYESLISKAPSFSFDPYMSDADIRDCEFLLAEAYHQMGKLEEAAWLYEKVLEKEREKAYFRIFAQEIELMLKDIYVQYINRAERSEEVLNNVQKILVLGIPNREIAWIYKKAAEAYYRVDDISSAMESLKQAFRICPGLTGAKKISRKLGIESRTNNR